MSQPAARGTPAGPVRAHLKKLRHSGATAAWIAQRSGVCERTVRSVLNGERASLYRGTAQALLDVTDAPHPSRRRVDPARTVERVHELLERHWPLHAIADAAGLSPATVLDANMSTGVSEQTAAAVERAYRLLGDRDGPGPRPYPALAGRIRDYGDRQVAAGAGVAPTTVRRIKAGMPVTRAAAVRVSTWLWRHEVAAAA